MTEAKKKPRGRPAIDPAQVAVAKSIRLTPAEWGDYVQAGGTPWLRKKIKQDADRVERAKAKK